MGVYIYISCNKPTLQLTPEFYIFTYTGFCSSLRTVYTVRKLLNAMLCSMLNNM